MQENSSRVCSVFVDRGAWYVSASFGQLDAVTNRNPDQQPCPSPPWTDARTALAIVTSSSLASLHIFANQ